MYELTGPQKCGLFYSLMRLAPHVSNRCKSGICPIVGRIQSKARVSIERKLLIKE